jgi:aminoglycoside 6'-N-acetyltransferase
MSRYGRVRLRRADIGDLEILKYWETQPHVMESGIEDEWEWETELLRNPPWRDQLIAEVDGRPIGVLQIIDPAEEDTHYWGDVEAGLRAIDIWIGEAEFLNRGFGTQMMNQALERCFADPEVNSILIDPLKRNLKAHRFYRRFGFKELGQRFFGDDDCLVFRLNRDDYIVSNHTLTPDPSISNNALMTTVSVYSLFTDSFITDTSVGGNVAR